MAGGNPVEVFNAGAYNRTVNAKQGDLGSKVLKPRPSGTVWKRGGIGVTPHRAVLLLRSLVVTYGLSQRQWRQLHTVVRSVWRDAQLPDRVRRVDDPLVRLVREVEPVVERGQPRERAREDAEAVRGHILLPSNDNACARREPRGKCTVFSTRACYPDRRFVVTS